MCVFAVNCTGGGGRHAGASDRLLEDPETRTRHGHTSYRGNSLRVYRCTATALYVSYGRWAGVSTSLYFGLCTIRLRYDSCGTDGNSCHVYMHRGLYLLDVGLLNLEATVLLLSAHHFGFSAPCKYENLARKKGVQMLWSF